MHVHFEENSSSRCDSTIHCLSWMGKVPDTLPDEKGWKLNRNQYYQEGWLAGGNGKGVIGVTFTTSHCQKYNPPSRSNFNLRGHRSEVVMVRWNEPYQKLATCDAHGIIFVWIKHEGRWSIELINDRNSQVTDFAWSHDGRMALICYRDGFVLVGSVAGQRYWSSMLNLDSSSITCGLWDPQDTKVMFGTTDGQVVVMSSSGAMLVQVTVHDGMEINTIVWSCEKFNMDESESERNFKKSSPPSDTTSVSSDPLLAVCFKHGAIFLMSSYDDICPRIINTMLTGLKLDWSNCGEILAVGGFVRLPNLQCKNEVHLYTREGSLAYKIAVPSQGKPLTALTWGHNDKRLFVAAGCVIHVAWVAKQVPSLQFLTNRCIQKVLRLEKNVSKLCFPSKLKSGVRALFSPTIKSYIPDPFRLREFVSSLPPGNERLYCTMIRHGDETSGGHYTLYLEYLGGLVPLLKGKRASKIRPDFVIYDPKIKTLSGKIANEVERSDTTYNSGCESEEDSESDVSVDGCGSPRMQRRKRQKQFRPEKVDRSITFRTLDELFYNDNLPESNKLVEITSNIWGTKFRITGTASCVPEDLGQVLYKTSLLHLQPRQMTVMVTELSSYDIHSYSRDPNFTPAGMSEEEDDSNFMDLDVLHNFSSDKGVPVLPADVCVHSVTAHHCEVQEFLGVDSSYNSHNDPALSIDSDSNKSGQSSGRDSEQCSPTKNGSPLFRCSGKPCRTSSIKSRSLSPAESHSTAQNNAFRNLCDQDSSDLLKDSYANQGARPKIVQPSDRHNGLDQVTRENSVGVMQSSSSRLSAHLPNLPTLSHHPRPDPSTVGRVLQQDLQNSILPRWADRACQGIKFIDDETCEGMDIPVETNTIYDCSNVTLCLSSESQRRLYLAHTKATFQQEPYENTEEKCSNLGKSFSESMETCALEETLDDDFDDLCEDAVFSKHGSLDTGIDVLGIRPHNHVIDETSYQSTSLPASPIKRKLASRTKKLKQEILLSKAKLSPLFGRKNRPVNLESSEEDFPSLEELQTGQGYRNLESFQKAQLKQKLKRAKSRGENDKSPRVVKSVKRKQLIMYNKAPLWNESSQVYQLDFGGRVTQESAKNFQIEFRGRQVMQFGRIDGNAYTLDFQYPFSALQAFAVALANVTQRLK